MLYIWDVGQCIIKLVTLNTHKYFYKNFSLSLSLSLSLSHIVLLLFSAIVVKFASFNFLSWYHSHRSMPSTTPTDTTQFVHNSNSTNHHTFNFYIFNCNAITIIVTFQYVKSYVNQTWLRQLHPMEASVTHHTRSLLIDWTHWWHNTVAITFCTWYCWKCNFSC